MTSIQKEVIEKVLIEIKIALKGSCWNLSIIKERRQFCEAIGDILDGFACLT